MGRPFYNNHMRYCDGRYILVYLGEKQKRYAYNPPWWRRWSPSMGKPHKKAFHKAKRKADRQELIGRQPRHNYARVIGMCKWKGR